MASLLKIVGFILMLASILFASFSHIKMNVVLAIAVVGAVAAATGESIKKQQ